MRRQAAQPTGGNQEVSCLSGTLATPQRLERLLPQVADLVVQVGQRMTHEMSGQPGDVGVDLVDGGLVRVPRREESREPCRGNRVGRQGTTGRRRAGFLDRWNAERSGFTSAALARGGGTVQEHLVDAEHFRQVPARVLGRDAHLSLVPADLLAGQRAPPLDLVVPIGDSLLRLTEVLT